MALRDFFYDQLRRTLGLNVQTEGTPTETAPTPGGVSVLAQVPLLQKRQEPNPLQNVNIDTGPSGMELAREDMGRQIEQRNAYDDLMRQRRRRQSALYALFNEEE